MSSVKTFVCEGMSSDLWVFFVVVGFCLGFFFGGGGKFYHILSEFS